MTVRNRTDYETLLQALGACISARIPALLWGDPGEGKTSVIESARRHGWHVETVIVSHYEPSDFAGLPVLGPDGSVTLAPPAWARRIAAHDGPSLAFFDEWSTASPSVQAAALRPLTHGEVGALQLPDRVSFVAAANPLDVAAGGWELAPPTANRFVHLSWHLPLEVSAECSVTGRWPTIPVYGPVDAAELATSRVLVAGFLRSRQSQLKAIPQDAAGRGGAFPTPRSWDFAARLTALARTHCLGPEVARLLVAGAVGTSTAHEFLVWCDAQDLPDPEALLADPASGGFRVLRADRVYVALQSVASVVTTHPSADRWSAAIRVCAVAADEGHLDSAVPVVRALVRDGSRPDGAQVPAEIKVFAAPLSLAGLLP
jgi:hypothetical protein